MSGKMKHVAVATFLIACSEAKPGTSPIDKPPTVVSDVDFTALDELCPGEPRVDECAGITPRLDFIVTDESGAPLANVLVGSYPEEPKRDATVFPAKDGLGRAKYYGTCTNAEGKASICPLDPAKTSIQTIVGLKAGYQLASTGKETYEATEVKHALPR